MMPPSTGHAPPAARRWPTVLVVTVLVAVATGCGGTDPGTSASGTTAAAASSTTTTTEALERSAPRWETVTTLTGTGATTTEPFAILPEAIQWRTRWKCQSSSGSLRISTLPPPRRAAPMVDAACPGEAIGYSIVSGSVRLKVEATGPWELVVDQQIDIPLREPPLEGMASAPVLGRGEFYNVEMEGKGTATLYRMPEGPLAVRFEDFQVSNNTDLFLWISAAAEPRTSADAASSEHIVAGNLRSTLGSQNYVLPADVTPERARSIVIWCQPVSVAYIAVALKPPA